MLWEAFIPDHMCSGISICKAIDRALLMMLTIVWTILPQNVDLWQLGYSECRTHLLYNGSIYPFHNSIVLGYTRFRLLMVNVMLFAVLLKFIKGTTYHCLSRDPSTALISLSSTMVSVETFGCMTFCFQHIQLNLMWNIINKGDKITITMQQPYLNGTTYIWMYQL